MSHWAGYLLPALDRPGGRAGDGARAGGSHALVLYWFKQRRRGPERPLEPLDRLYELRGNRSDGERRPALWAQLCNWQSRALLSVFHDTSELAYSAGPSDDAELCARAAARRRRARLHRRCPGPVRRVPRGARAALRLGRPSSRGARSTPRARPRTSPPSSARRSSPTTGSTRSCTSWRRGRSRNRRGRVARDPLDAELYELARQAQLRREELEQPTRDDTPTSPASPDLGRRLTRLVAPARHAWSRVPRDASSSGADTRRTRPGHPCRQARARWPVPRRGRLRAPLLDSGASADPGGRDRERRDDPDPRGAGAGTATSPAIAIDLLDLLRRRAT